MRVPILIPALALAFAMLVGVALPAARAQALAPGTVVALQGTPHLWIADGQGVVHWAGDTRALAGRHVNWSARLELGLTGLRSLPIGDPWLSAGLLKDGDPIYLVKWETEWPQPQLLHIQSISDVELFGINGSNWGRFVLDRATWEARYGLSVAGLPRGVLAPAVAETGPADPTSCPDGQRWDYHRETCVPQSGSESPPPPPPAGSTTCPEGQRWDYYKNICVDRSPREQAAALVDPALMPALDIYYAIRADQGLDADGLTFGLIAELGMTVTFGAVREGAFAWINVWWNGRPPRIVVSDAHRGASARALAAALAHELWHAYDYRRVYPDDPWGTFEACIATEVAAMREQNAVWSWLRPGGYAQLSDFEKTFENWYQAEVAGVLEDVVRDEYRDLCAAAA